MHKLNFMASIVVSGDNNDVGHELNPLIAKFT